MKIDNRRPRHVAAAGQVPNPNRGEPEPMTAAQFCRLAARYSNMTADVRRAVDALALADTAEADRHAAIGTDARRAADRYLLELDAAGAAVGPARPAAARTVPMFAD